MKTILSARALLVGAIAAVSFVLSVTSCATLGMGGLRIGGSEAGSIQSGGMSRHMLKVSEAGPVVIDVIASQQELDPMVELQNSSGATLGSDDDGGGGRNARLRVQLQPGTYTIIVRGYGPTSGSYRVSASRQGQEGGGGTAQPTVRDRGSIRVGDTKNGTIGQYEAHQYNLSIDSKKMLVIDGSKAQGSNFDPYLVLMTDNGTPIKQDDDSGGNLNARIQSFVNEGKYRVVIKGYSSSVGDYELSVKEMVIRQLSLGQPVAAALQPGEKHYYSLAVSQNGLYDIKGERTEKSALDPFLALGNETGQIMYRDDDSGGELNAKITCYLQEGSYMILAEGSDIAGGGYRISAEKSTVNPQPHTAIAPGQTRNGWLIPEARHTYTMALDHEALVVLMNRKADASGLDPYLTLETAEGELINRDDDSGGGDRSAMIIGRLKKGTYKVIASAFGSTSGQYSLSAKSQSSKGIHPGETKSGALKAGEFDIYRFDAAKEGMCTIDMTKAAGSTIDPFLTLMTGEGKVISRDDDSGGSLNSRIVNFFNKGEYFIMASGLGTTSGAYNLVIRSMEAKRIELGESKTGTLTPGGQEFYSLTMKKSGLVTIDAEKGEGSNVDPMLILKSKNGMTVAQDDDGGGNLNARIVHFLSEGTYSIVVSGYGGTGGNYVLRTGVNEDVQAVERTIQLGQTVTGTISHPQQKDRYSFSVASYTNVVIRAKKAGNSMLDPYLELLDGSGAMIISDDDGARDRNALIARHLGPGQYSVVVKSYGNSTGQYLLSTMDAGNQQVLPQQQQQQQQQQDGPQR